MALQMFVCAQMLRDYSRNAPITEAIQKTFSGTAPCTMCKVIAEKQQREEKTPSIVKLGLNFGYNTRAYYGWNNFQFGLKALGKSTKWYQSSAASATALR